MRDVDDGNKYFLIYTLAVLYIHIYLIAYMCIVLSTTCITIANQVCIKFNTVIAFRTPLCFIDEYWDSRWLYNTTNGEHENH